MKIRTTVPCLFALALSACNAQTAPAVCTYPGPLVYNSAEIPATGALAPTGAPSPTLVSDQPVLHFPLPIPSLKDVEKPDFQVTLGSPYGTPHRTLQIDLFYTPDGNDPKTPKSEIQLAWNDQLAYSYGVLSYETRVAPSSTPGATLILDVVELSPASPQSPSGTSLAVLSAWKMRDQSWAQQGPGEIVADPSPFDLSQTIYPTMPYYGNETTGCN
jgi:hypothetical protein